MFVIAGPFIPGWHFREIWLGVLLATALHFVMWFFIHGWSMIVLGAIGSSTTTTTTTETTTTTTATTAKSTEDERTTTTVKTTTPTTDSPKTGDSKSVGAIAVLLGASALMFATKKRNK